MEAAGASAVVLHSLFEEQISMESHQLDQFLSQGADSHAEFSSYFPDMSGYNLGPDGYLKHLTRVKAAVKIPVIASLNGTSTGGWIEYAQKMVEAGADALELNIYYLPTDPELRGSDVEQKYIDLVKAVKAAVKIPVAVKLGPYFSAMANFAQIGRAHV